MNKTFVADLENHEVYLINSGDISFYINIAKEKDSTNITLDINTRKKDDIKRLISYYEKIDNYNITLVIPLIKIKEEYNEFKNQSNTISRLINYSYKILQNNKIEVKEKINIVKHKNYRSDFVEFFIKNFSNRVRYLTVDDLVHEEVPYNKINAANISFVIGKPELDLTITDDEMKDIIKETKNISTEKEAKPKLNFASASGFISYYLLGALTAIITLLVLTLLVK